MAKGKIKVIKEWLFSCFLEQSEEQFPAVLVRQGGMRNLLQLNEDRLDEVNSRENIAETNVIGSVIDHAEPT